MALKTARQVNIVYWEEDGGWLGYLSEYPAYWTQGKTLNSLKRHLRDLFKDVASGQIPQEYESGAR
jgi:predicted RNase H-like HicB family nuclease